jgi:predicted transcriptional regulator
MPDTRPGISESEMQVLRVLWEAGEGTVRDVDGRLERPGQRWAYTTVATLLQRLETKGYVTSDKSRVPHVFRAAVSRDMLLGERLKSLADELAGGTATPLVQALVSGVRFTEQEIRELRRLVDEAEVRSRGGKAARGRRKG